MKRNPLEQAFDKAVAKENKVKKEQKNTLDSFFKNIKKVQA